MQFGKYRLIRRLAAGGMAEIFLARQEGMEGFRKELVIKRILPIHADNDELIEMFLDEARIAATLSHPNVVQIYDLGRCDGEYFIAMEYVHGQDLRRICERGLAVGNFLPVRHAVRIIADAAAGLYYAHNQVDSDGQPLHIVHRDISPQNLMVSFDGVVKLLDFGIAKAANKIVTTRHGQLKGKYAYMSPEQCNGLEVDHRSDLFSLGTLLYEVTVCTRLFKGDTDIQTIKNVSEAVIPPPTQVRPGFPKDLETILLKALARDPNDRYQTGRDFQVDLEDFLSNNRMKTGAVQLGNYMREIFPDKLDRPGEDPEFIAESEAQARARAQVAAQRQPPVGGVSIGGVTLGAGGPKLPDARPAAPEAEAWVGGAAASAPSGRASMATGAVGAVDDRWFNASMQQMPSVPLPGGPAPTKPSVDERWGMDGPALSLPQVPALSNMPSGLTGQLGVVPAKDDKPAAGGDAVAYATSPDAPWNTGGQAPKLDLGLKAGPTEPMSKADEEPRAVSFVRNPQAGGSDSTVEAKSGKKREPRKIDASEVKKVEYRLRGNESPAKQEKGSQVFYYALGVVVLLLGGLAVWQVAKGGLTLAGSNLLEGAGPDKPGLDIKPEPPPPPLPTVLVRVESTPPGASVVVNGVLQEGETPGDFKVVPDHINTVSLYKEGFRPRHKNLQAPPSGQPEGVQLDLVEIKAPEPVDPKKEAPKKDPKVEEAPTPQTVDLYSKVELKVTSEPPDALVLLNGKEAGRTPLAIQAHPGIEHHITLRKDGFYDHVVIQYILPEIANATPTAALVPLDRKGAERTCEVKLDTRDVEIKLDDQPAGFGPFFRPLGRNEVIRAELTLAQHHPWRRALATTVGGFVLLPELQPIRKVPGFLTLSFLTPDLTVYVGPEEYGPDEVKKISLPEGEHRVRLVRPDKTRGDVTITVDGEAEATYEIDFSGDKPVSKRTQ